MLVQRLLKMDFDSGQQATLVVDDCRITEPLRPSFYGTARFSFTDTAGASVRITSKNDDTSCER